MVTWQTNGQIIIDQASVPEAVRLPDGRWLWYTPLVMLLTLAAGFALGRAVSKVFFARKH